MCAAWGAPARTQALDPPGASHDHGRNAGSAMAIAASTLSLLGLAALAIHFRFRSDLARAVDRSA